MYVGYLVEHMNNSRVGVGFYGDRTKPFNLPGNPSIALIDNVEQVWVVTVTNCIFRLNSEKFQNCYVKPKMTFLREIKK